MRGPQHEPGPDRVPELQYEGLHVAGVHHRGHPCVQQRVQVFLIPENIESDAVRPAEQMHMHVGEARKHRAALAVDAPTARRHMYIRRIADGDYPPSFDHDGAMLNGCSAIAVDDSDICQCCRIRARQIRRQYHHSDADVSTDFSCRKIPTDDRALFMIPRCFA